jgi:type II secretory pathway component PulF
MGDFELNMMPPIMDVLVILFEIGLCLLALRLLFGLFHLFHLALTLPMRRAERARQFLSLLETAQQQGLPLEETLISLANSRDESLGVDFHLLAAWLETGLPFGEALARVPYFLPPQVNAMLRAGRQMGDMRKVLPACRQLLKDGTSEMRGALNYLVVITFVVAPFGCFMYWMIMVVVMPKFMEVFAGMGVSHMPVLMLFLFAYLKPIVLCQMALFLFIWQVVLIYIGGPRVTAWFPLLEKLQYRLPWRRRRMQRDFSTMLAVLLDAGASEAAALTLAADCAANSVFRRHAAAAVAALGQGLKLPDAVQRLDDAGEFRWRLRNAAAGPGGFLRALTGWHEALDARAFQQEQAAAHVITTSLVLWNGLFVGLILVSVFMVLTSLINTAVLW